MKDKIKTAEQFAYYLDAFNDGNWSSHAVIAQVTNEIELRDKAIQFDATKAATDRMVEMQQEQAAFEAGIRNEFTVGEMSGDLISDFGTFIEHHQALEKELAETKTALLNATKAAWDKVDEILGNYNVTLQGNEWFFCQRIRNMLKQSRAAALEKAGGV